MKNTTSLTVGLLTVLVALGASDALFIENGRLLGSRQRKEQRSEEPTTMGTSASSIPSERKGTPKATGPNVLELLAVEQITLKSPKEERSLIEQVIPTEVASIQTNVLMKENDRIGLMAWTESPEISIYFLALKEALHSSFSSQMRDLVDEVQEQEGKPPRSLLTFIDPSINEERIVFVAIRERLYEFHVAAGKDDTVFELIEALTM